MKIKIWGARGSIPSPIRPDEIREKIISAMLSISKIEKREFREELISAILEEQLDYDAAGQLSSAAGDHIAQTIQLKRRQIIQMYVDNLSPLLAGTVGGNTPCVEIQAEGTRVIIDAGSGIRKLGLELMKEGYSRGQGVIHLFFSHPHWDHIQGFPFFRPAFIPGNKIFIYSVHDMEMALRRQQEFISFPVSLADMQAEIIFRRLKPEEMLEIGNLRIRNICNQHPGDSYSFRFEKGDKVFVYASDASYPTEMDLRPYINFFAGADVLIYDAQFTQRESDEKEDWGHSSSFVGVEMAQQAKVKKLVLYHYDPTYSDKDLEKILEDTLKFQRNQYPAEEPVEVIIAQEGQVFDLTPPQVMQLQQVPGGRAAISKPSGIFNERVAIELKEQLAALKQEGWSPQLIIDMSSVEMLQVTGLRALVKLMKEQRGVPIVLAGPSLNVQQLIELTGYLDLFPIYPSVHAALNALQAREKLNLPGHMIKNRYYIEAKINDGHLGTVFKAIDTRLNSPVALKVLSASFSDGAIARFLQQARQIIDLTHPNIVNIYDCDEDHGLSYMVEEFIEARTLQDLLDEQPGQPFPLETALSIAENMARALEYAHAHGVIHGDLKPQNVLLADPLKISDFGLGRLESGKSLLNNIDVPLALVSAHYLAPEQVLGHPIDARTDLYALGIILYQLVTGQLPFGGSDQEVLEHHRSSLPRPPRELNPALSPSLEHLILKLLDKDPNKRYATARQTRRVLASIVAIPDYSRPGQALIPRQRSTLIGRAEALQRLIDLWAETRQGRGRLVFVTGEAGIGKTRLIQELIRRVEDATVLLGHCWELERSSAYQPFIQALRTYFATVPAELAQQQVGQVLAEMGQIIPEVGQLMPTLLPDFQIPPSRATLPKGVRGTPAKSVSLAQSIAQTTLNRPWLLVLEDVQWADLSSLQLLHYLARRCGSMALMIVATYSSYRQDNRFLTETLSSLNRHVSYTTISLDPLAEGEVKALLESIWAPPVPGDLTMAIYRRTKGNPFYVEELAKGLVDEDVVNWRDGHWHFAPIVEVGLPQRIRDAVLRRMNRLSKETQTLLHQAAILGYTFKFDDLHEVSDLSAWDALESLDTALERQLVRELPSEGWLRFSHAQIQRILYENLSPLKRRLMHHEVGEALERRYLPEPGRLVTDLAYHFFQAKELEKGLAYSIQAAMQANQVHAGPQALNWYTQALDALDQLEPDETNQAQRFELLLAREQIYGDLGEGQAQVADLAQLQKLAQASDDSAKQAMVHYRQARYEYRAGRLAEATTEAQAGLIAARQAGQAILEGKNLLQLGHLAMSLGDFETAQKHMQAAQERLAETEDRPGEADSLNGLGTIARYQQDYPQAERYYQQALALNQAAGNRSGQATSLNHLGGLCLDAGDYTQAKAYSQQALEMNRAINQRRGEAACLHTLAAVYQELGHYQAARNYIEEALAIHQQVDDPAGQAEDLALSAAVHLASGDETATTAQAQQALEMFQRLMIRAQEGAAWFALGLALETAGDLTQAGEAYRQAQTLQRELVAGANVLDAQAGLARSLLATGNLEAAQQEAEACLAQRRQPGLRYPVRLYLTLYHVLRAADRIEEATPVLQEGYALLQKRAEQIDEPDLRASFLKNVLENKELLLQMRQDEQKEVVG